MNDLFFRCSSNSRRKARSAQAIIELGILGGLLLFMLMSGVLFMLQVNQDASISMETFRRALREARPNPNGTEGEYSPGYAVAYSTLVTDRSRQFQKDTAPIQKYHSTASVYWVVPSIDELAGSDFDVSDKNKVVYKINEDVFDVDRFNKEALMSNGKVINKNIKAVVTTPQDVVWKRQSVMIDKAGVSMRKRIEDVSEKIDVLLGECYGTCTGDPRPIGAKMPVTQVLALKKTVYGKKDVYKKEDNLDADLYEYEYNNETGQKGVHRTVGSGIQ